MKAIELDFIFEGLKMVFLALLVVLPIRYFLLQPFIVKGESMEPNFENRDYLLVDEISFRFREPEREEVVVFKPPNQPESRYIKRIIGLPGETVKIFEGQIIIVEPTGQARVLDESGYLAEGTATPGGLTVSLGPREYFVLGDNRSSSYDSRRWGSLPRENIVGRVFLRVFPWQRFVWFQPKTD